MRLRELKTDDYELLLAWRNNPRINGGFYSQRAGHTISWPEHMNWLKSRQNWKIFVIVLSQENTDRRIGVVTIGQLDHWEPEVGYYIGELTLWGMGYGKKAVLMALEWLQEHGYKFCHTTVLKDNERSLRLLKSLGFEVTGDARQGEVWLHKKL